MDHKKVLRECIDNRTQLVTSEMKAVLDRLVSLEYSSTYWMQQAQKVRDDAPTTDYGWLVENGKSGDELRYRTWKNGFSHWTADPNEATRYCRRIDADNVHQEDDQAMRIVEHAWHNEPSPERDNSRPAERQGIFRKFNVSRVDGSDAACGKHHGCRYFVLDLDHDEFAVATMRKYAAECKATHPELAADLEKEFGSDEPATVEAAELQTLLVSRYSDCRPSFPTGLYGWARIALTQTTSEPPSKPQLTDDFEQAFQLIFEAYSMPLDQFSGDRDAYIWTRRKVTSAFSLMQKVRANSVNAQNTDAAVAANDAAKGEYTPETVIDLHHVAIAGIRDRYIETFGPLDPNLTTNDIDYHICEIIKVAPAVDTLIKRVGDYAFSQGENWRTGDGLKIMDAYQAYSEIVSGVDASNWEPRTTQQIIDGVKSILTSATEPPRTCYEEGMHPNGDPL